LVVHYGNSGNAGGSTVIIELRASNTFFDETHLQGHTVSH